MVISRSLNGCTLYSHSLDPHAPIQQINFVRLLCSQNQLAIIQWLSSLGVIQITKSDFIQACRNGSLELAQYCYNVHREINNQVRKDHETMEELLCYVCNHNPPQLLLAQWLYSIGARINDSALYYAILHGHTVMIQWLYSVPEIKNNVSRRFLYACMEGNLEVISTLSHSNELDINTVKDRGFEWACETKQLSVLQWLFTYDPTLFKNILIECPFANDSKKCEGLYLFAKWLYSLHGVVIQDNSMIFLEACRRCHSHIIRKHFNSAISVSISVDSIRPDIIDIALQEACRHGHIELLQILSLNFLKSIHENFGIPFQEACKHGHLNIAKMIHTIYDIPAFERKLTVHKYYIMGFQHACNNNHFPIAQWLQSLGQKAYRRKQYGSFLEASRQGTLEMVQWLYSLGGINAKAVGIAFKLAYRERHWLVMQWLNELGRIAEDRYHEIWIETCCTGQISDLHQLLPIISKYIPYSQVNDGFGLVCKHGHLAAVEWSAEVVGPHNCLDYNCAFREACISSQLEVVEWLYLHHEESIDKSTLNLFSSKCCVPKVTK
jgi:hypothetical protein